MTTVAKRLEIIQKLEKGMTIDKLVMEYVFIEEPTTISKKCGSFEKSKKFD